MAREDSSLAGGFKPWHLLMLGLAALILLSLLPTGLLLTHPRGDKKDLHILCTFLPVYVFTLNVVGDTPGVHVEMLVGPDAGCPHDYAVRPADLKRAAAADVIVAQGQGIDAFAEELAKTNPRARLITITESWQDLQQDVNPHMWVSLGRAIRMAHTLTLELAAADHSRAEAFVRNQAPFTDRLSRLAVRMQEASRHFKNRRIVTFHPAFEYLASELNLEIVATLTDDPEHPPSARRIAEVIETIKRTHPAAIFYEPAYSDRLARTVSRETNVPVYALNPFNTVEGEPTARSYEEVMEHNLQVLQQALGSNP